MRVRQAGEKKQCSRLMKQYGVFKELKGSSVWVRCGVEEAGSGGAKNGKRWGWISKDGPK